MSDKSKDETFLARWLSGELSAEEQAAFEAREDAELLRKIADASSELDVPKRDRTAAWEALQQQTIATRKEAKVRRMPRWWTYAAAAVVVLLSGWFLLRSGANEWTTVTAPMAQKMVYELPDGSEVWLNAASEMRFREADFLDNRQLELRGEGFFDVEPGSSFEVQTELGVVRVLGTSFTVFSRDEQLEVRCYTGRVGVNYAESQAEAILEPGDVVNVTDEQLSRTKVEEALEMPEWTRGNSRFRNAKFSLVIDELERQYDLQINYPSALDTIQDYNGGFPHRDLETALEVVFSSVSHNYRVVGDQVEVFQSGE